MPLAKCQRCGRKFFYFERSNSERNDSDQPTLTQVGMAHEVCRNCRKKAIRQHYEQIHGPSKPLQFTLRTALLVLTVASLSFWDWQHKQKQKRPSGPTLSQYPSITSRHDADGGGYVMIVMSPDPLRYVVFVHNASGGPMPAPRVGKDGVAVLPLSDGTQIKLPPGNDQIYEIREGTLRSVPGKVSPETLDQYLRTCREGASAANLLEFAQENEPATE